MLPAHRSRSTPKKIVPASPPLVVNPNLRRAVAKLCVLLAKSDVWSAESHHEIGREVLKVHDLPSKYGLKPGESAVDRLVLETGYSDDTIRNDLTLAQCWKLRDFCQWLQREGKDGARLTSAHFLEVAKLDDAKDRDALLEKALAEGMSYRAVRRAVRGEAPDLDPDATPLEKIIAATEKAIKTAARFTARIDRVAESGGAEDAKLAGKAAELQLELSEQWRKNSAALQLKREALERAAVTPVDLVAKVPVPALDVAPVIVVAGADPGAQIIATEVPTTVATGGGAGVQSGELVADVPNPAEPLIEPVVEDPAEDSSNRGASETLPALAPVGAVIGALKKRPKLRIIDEPGPATESPKQSIA